MVDTTSAVFLCSLAAMGIFHALVISELFYKCFSWNRLTSSRNHLNAPSVLSPMNKSMMILRHARYYIVSTYVNELSRHWISWLMHITRPLYHFACRSVCRQVSLNSASTVYLYVIAERQYDSSLHYKLLYNIADENEILHLTYFLEM